MKKIFVIIILTLLININSAQAFELKAKRIEVHKLDNIEFNKKISHFPIAASQIFEIDSKGNFFPLGARSFSGGEEASVFFYARAESCGNQTWNWAFYKGPVPVLSGTQNVNITSAGLWGIKITYIIPSISGCFNLRHTFEGVTYSGERPVCITSGQ